MMASSLYDLLVLTFAAFAGNAGVAVTGFGMAIIYIFLLQIAILLGYENNFRYAIFIQAVALFAAQPLLLYKAEVHKHASKPMLWYFIPVTIIATPLGQIAGEWMSTELIEAVGGVLVTFVAVFEIYQKRRYFAAWASRGFRKTPFVSKEVKTADIESVETTDDGVDKSFHQAYSLGKMVGEGGYSTVKICTHKQSGLVVAAKIVDKAMLLDAEDMRLQEEIKLLQHDALVHPNIVRFHKCFEEPESYYIVTELMSGGDVLSRLQEKTCFSEAHSQSLFTSILSAVCHIHHFRIAHRDLKPENFLLCDTSPSSTVKLADFGFAKEETQNNSFLTMCGTTSYVAPEVLARQPYGLKADMWSLGIVLYVLLVGYQPFRGERDELVYAAIQSGSLTFDEQFWKYVSVEAQDLIKSLVELDIGKRLDAAEASTHPWLGKTEFCASVQEKEGSDGPVFFMIGSQRSGSNWLRTMLDQREDLACPHPPHIMRDYLPNIERFGDLSVDENFRILVDHVCTFVESNQVVWTDKHGKAIKFVRPAIYEAAKESFVRVEKARKDENHDSLPLEPEMYLLSVFDSVMNFFTRVNGKHTWMCKSMGMSRYHDTLVEFYGRGRLRYIYLVRDPRDVAMSFMKTPVGDCHFHAIITKWVSLQNHALKILELYPELIHKVHYENILLKKEEVVKGVYDFIGERRFGGVKRQASVMFMSPTSDLINDAKNGREAQKASSLSTQFENLGRGASFAATQNQKWRHPDTGLKMEDIQLLESVAHERMADLGYECHLVGKTTEATQFSQEDLDLFSALNAKGIKEMNEALMVDNPGDFERRNVQADALNREAKMSTEWDGQFEESGELAGHDSPSSRLLDLSEASTSFHFLSDLDGAFELTELPNRTFELPIEGFEFRVSGVSQRGYNPLNRDQPNQDVMHVSDVTSRTDATAPSLWVQVLDGHGPRGHDCAEQAAKDVLRLYEEHCSYSRTKTALEKAHILAHKYLTENKEIDTSQSGTTSASVLFLQEGTFIVSNVGDSTCILGQQTNTGIVGKLLCKAHTLFRPDERQRIKRAGGVIMTLDQKDGTEPMHEAWKRDDKTPPRIWSPHDDGKFPGCGFTRSIGDVIAHTLGVTSRPEMFDYKLSRSDRFLVVASDGIAEYLTPDDCVDICNQYDDPHDAAQALINESTIRWMEHGEYIDDQTAIVIFLKSKEPPLDREAQFWTLLAGAASGFLGGLCGIRGPPIILFFLHAPVTFTKESQRATGASITAVNVIMRIAYYLVETSWMHGEAYFNADDWLIYVSVVLGSVLGVLVGSKMFEYLKDSRNALRGILSLFLLLCGVSLLLSSFASGL